MRWRPRAEMLGTHSAEGWGSQGPGSRPPTHGCSTETGHRRIYGDILANHEASCETPRKSLHCGRVEGEVTSLGATRALRNAIHPAKWDDSQKSSWGVLEP